MDIDGSSTVGFMVIKTIVGWIVGGSTNTKLYYLQ